MNKMPDCHICGGQLSEIDGFSALHQVTSDCRPWRRWGHICICQHCGTVQKPITEEWLSETEEIYSDYEVYCQGGGEEQSTFEPESGVGVGRSYRIITWLDQNTCLPEQGKLLDVGCGNGSFLKAFNAYRDGWNLTGLEIDDRNKKTIETIPKARLRTGSIDDIDQQYDMVVLIHVLEHIPNPLEFLASISDGLSEKGQLIIEVPNLETSPFDVLIGDHCTHFTAQSLKGLIKVAGFEVLELSRDFISKELSLLSKPRERLDQENFANEFPDLDSETEKGRRIVQDHIAWLKAILEQSLENQEKLGVFGSSISATWLASELNGKITFFVDEDINRINRSHMCLPIIGPDGVPDKSKVLRPMRFDIAQAILNRFPEKNRKNFILPVNQT